MIIDLLKLGKDTHRFLFGFFEAEARKNKNVWHKESTYTFENTDFNFQQDAFRRKRKNKRTGFRYEILSANKGNERHRSNTRKIDSTLKIEEQEFSYTSINKRLGKIQEHTQDHPLSVAVKESEIGSLVDYVSSKEPAIESLDGVSGTSYMAMKFIPGDTLHQVLEQKYDIYQAHEISKQFMTCLIYLQTLGIIHCDLKPSNTIVQLSPKIHVFIIDFGLSILNNGTKPDKIGGTRGYWSPEANHKQISLQSDVFSAARVIARLWKVNLSSYELDLKAYRALIESVEPEDLLTNLFDGLNELKKPAQLRIYGTLKNMLESDPKRRYTAKQSLQGLTFNLDKPPSIIHEVAPLSELPEEPEGPMMSGDQILQGLALKPLPAAEEQKKEEACCLLM